MVTVSICAVKHLQTWSVVMLSLLISGGCGDTELGDDMSSAKSGSHDNGHQPQATSSNSFALVDSLEEVGSKSAPSPYDVIKDPNIPFELKTNDLPDETIGFIPAIGLTPEHSRTITYVFGRGKYISVRGTNRDPHLLDTDSKKQLPVPFNLLPGGVSDDGMFVVSSRGVSSHDDIKFNRDPFLSFFEHPKLRTLQSSVPYAAEFSKDGKLVAIGFGGVSSTLGICLVDLHSRRITQVMDTGCFPAQFSDGDNFFRCFSTEGSIMTYRRNGENGFQGVARSDYIFQFEAGGTGYLSSAVFGEGFLITTSLNVPEGEAYSDGRTVLSLFSIDGSNIRRVSQELYGALFEGPYATGGSRFALFGMEAPGYANAGARWLCYGDAKTKHVAFLQIPESMMFAGLDTSGRYAFFTGLQNGKQLAILRLAKD